MKRIAKRLSITLITMLIIFQAIVISPIISNASTVLYWPVPGHTKISQGFHNDSSIDISDGSISGADIVAALGGKVTHKYTCTQNHPGSNGDCDGFGTGIVIKGTDGRTYHYAHMLAGSIPSNIKIGSTISAGQKIGKVGNTGNSTGAHLHFGISIGDFWNESGIDPSKETYIYSVSSDSSSSDTTTPSFNIVFSSPDSDYANKAFVNNTNACVVNKVTRTDGGKIDKVGIILYDYNDKQLAKKEESTSSTKVPFHLWYNINSSLGVTLTKGTLYKYKFYAVAGGKTFYSSLNTLVTTGNYTLSFNSNGGSTVSSKQVVCGKTYGSLSTPTKTGYTFKGWYTSSSGGSEVTSSTVCSSKSNHTLYAQWTPNKLSVYFNSNGGSVSSDTYTVKSNLIYYKSDSSKYYQTWTYNNTKENGLINASTFGLSRTGYTFAGWGTTSTGGTIFSQSDTSLKPTDINSDIANKSCSTTLYAIWKKITYTLSYNANGGSGAPSAQSGNTSYTVSSTKPTRSGYNFLGWSTSSTATSASYAPGSTISISKNTTLYAVWSKNTYTLSYDANGGSGAPSAQSGNTSYTVSSTKPTRSGYNFLGWSTSSTATSASYAPGSTISISKNTTLYAVWSKTNINTNTPTLKIQNNPGLKIINYGEKLKLTAIVTDMPSDAEIYWYMNDKKFGEGECVYLEGKGGFAKITAKLVDENGNVLTDSDGNEISDSQTVSVNASIWQIIISFFKNLFGINRTITQAFKGIF